MLLSFVCKALLSASALTLLLATSGYAAALRPLGDKAPKVQSALPGPSSITAAQAEAMSVAQAEAWDTACREMRIACKGPSALPPPQVAYGLLPSAFGMYQLGARTVLLDIRIIGQPFAFVVMVHEMVHYLQYRVLDENMSKCDAEEQAFRIGFKAALDRNIVDPRIKTWTEIRYIYGCGTSPPVIWRKAL